jgi:hypothetical protein
MAPISLYEETVRNKIMAEVRIRMRPFKVGFVANATLLAFTLAVFIVDGYPALIQTYLPTGILLINAIVVFWNAFLEAFSWDD